MALDVEKIRTALTDMDLVNSLSVKGLISAPEKDALVNALKMAVADSIRETAEKPAQPAPKKESKPSGTEKKE